MIGIVGTIDAQVTTNANIRSALPNFIEDFYMPKLRLGLIVLVLAANAHAVQMSFTDGCGGSLSASGATLVSGASGDLTLSTTSAATPYTVLGCESNPPTIPRCSLSASNVQVAPGGTATLVAKCTSSPTAFNWVKPAGWAGALSGSRVDLTFPTAGSYTFAVSGANASGTGAPSNAVTVLVASSTQAPVCTLTASPSALSLGQSTRLHATCNPVPSSYAWRVDTGTTLPSSATGSADITLNVAGTYTYGVQGVNGATGALATAAVTVTGTEVNLAATSAGAVATASSFWDVGVGALKNNERAGATYGAGGVWRSKLAAPDGFYVNLNGSYAVDRIVLYMMQDGYTSPVEPADSMTFTTYGAKDFDVYARVNDSWQLLTTVRNNTLVKKTVTFSPVTTAGIMINMLAMGCGAGCPPAATEIEIFAGGSANLALTSQSIIPNNGPASVNDFAPGAVNNGNRTGAPWAGGGVWQDFGYAYPDWVRIDFPAQKTVNRVVVYGMQDDYLNPVEPTDTMVCHSYCVEDFQVQTWNGSAWVTQVTVTANNLVKRSVPLPSSIMTSAIRIYITKATGDRSQLVEVEAWGF